MKARTVTVAADLSATESIDFAVLASRFKLSDAELATRLLRYALAISLGASDASAQTIENHLDERISSKEALVDEVRAIVAKTNRAAQSVEITSAIARERLIALPTPTPPRLKR